MADKHIVCPFTDYKGQTIRHGDTILHPDGTKGTVKLLEGTQAGRSYTDYNWFVDYGDKPYSLLQLQVGDKGRAEKI